jgi:hypothetical protein
MATTAHVAAMVRPSLLVSCRATRPVPRQKLVELKDRVLGDAGQHIGKPGLRIDVVHFGRNNQAVRNSSAPDMAHGSHVPTD